MHEAVPINLLLFSNQSKTKARRITLHYRQMIAFCLVCSYSTKTTINVSAGETSRMSMISMMTMMLLTATAAIGQSRARHPN